MEYFEGDIVEIITSKYKNQEEIPSHEKDRNEWLPPSPIIGQRFRVSIGGKENDYILSFRGNRNSSFCIHHDYLMLYHRPFKNKLKFLKRLFK